MPLSSRVCWIWTTGSALRSRTTGRAFPAARPSWPPRRRRTWACLLPFPQRTAPAAPARPRHDRRPPVAAGPQPCLCPPGAGHAADRLHLQLPRPSDSRHPGPGHQGGPGPDQYAAGRAGRHRLRPAVFDAGHSAGGRRRPDQPQLGHHPVADGMERVHRPLRHGHRLLEPVLHARRRRRRRSRRRGAQLRHHFRILPARAPGPRPVDLFAGHPGRTGCRGRSGSRHRQGGGLARRLHRAGRRGGGDRADLPSGGQGAETPRRQDPPAHRRRLLDPGEEAQLLADGFRLSHEQPGRLRPGLLEPVHSDADVRLRPDHHLLLFRLPAVLRRGDGRVSGRGSGGQAGQDGSRRLRQGVLHRLGRHSALLHRRFHELLAGAGLVPAGDPQRPDGAVRRPADHGHAAPGAVPYASDGGGLLPVHQQSDRDRRRLVAAGRAERRHDPPLRRPGPALFRRRPDGLLCDLGGAGPAGRSHPAQGLGGGRRSLIPGAVA
uniref:LigA n=1 Tax=Parastrongyloides trichosuri TaxID=131310 RepID=A0A0N4Z3S9_PARTI